MHPTTAFANEMLRDQFPVHKLTNDIELILTNVPNIANTTLKNYLITLLLSHNTFIAALIRFNIQYH
jgi:hypothetical protein